MNVLKNCIMELLLFPKLKRCLLWSIFFCYLCAPLLWDRSFFFYQTGLLSCWFLTFFFYFDNSSIFWASQRHWLIVMRSMLFIGISSQKICCLTMRYAKISFFCYQRMLLICVHLWQHIRQPEKLEWPQNINILILIQNNLFSASSPCCYLRL